MKYYKNQKKFEGKGDEKYTDDIFPLNANTFFGLDSNGNPTNQEQYSQALNVISKDDIAFKRASELYQSGSRYVLISDNMKMEDIVPGKIEDTYFLFAVQNLCKNPGNINKLFETNGTFANPSGYYEVKLFIDGEEQIVTVDDYLPVNKKTNELIGAKSTKNEIWVSLLEKAWAKINGGYANIIGGTPMDALEYLTGFSSLSYDMENKDNDDLNEYKIEIINQLQNCDIDNAIIACTTTSTEDVSSVGLISGYTYNLLAIYQIQDSNGNNVYLLRLRNPWSIGEWNGDWSDKSAKWDSNSKSKVKFADKADGIFYMSDNDFFKYFKHVEICYLLYGSKINRLTVTGEEKNTNGIVFNVITKKDGYLSVSVLRKNCRLYPDVKGKMLPTHISVVRYDSNFTNRLKCFSDYTGNFESYVNCSLNRPVKAGGYLVYIYRDLDHAEFIPDDELNINIVCSSEIEIHQMTYDFRDKGFPLLQNIILQAEFIENNYDPDKAEDFDLNSNQIRGNGIGHVIYYISTPGNFLSYTGSTKKVVNYIMLNPYLNAKTTKFNHVLSSGKYLVLLGLLTKGTDNYSFACFSKAYTTSKTMKEVYNTNDIDLKLYIDPSNNIQNVNIKQLQIQSLDNAKKDKFYDVGNETQQVKTLDQLKKEYSVYIQMLDDVPGDENDSNLKWVVIKGEYVIYVGQVNQDGKRTGKGILINPNNVFAGEFKYDLPNGKGYTYNGKNERQYYSMYENGVRKGDIVTAEEEAEMKRAEEEERKRLEEEERKRKEEEERKRKEEEARLAEEARIAEEKRKAEEARLAEEKRKAEEEAKRKAEEERLAEEKRKAEEARLAEEARKAEEKRKAEEARIAEELKKKEEELKRQEEEKKKQLEKEAEEAKKIAEQKKKEEEEKIKKEQERLAAELKALEQQKEEEAKKKAEELKKQQEELEKQKKQKEEEARIAAQKAAEEAERKKKELEEETKRLKEEAEKKAAEEKKKAEEAAKKAAEEKKKAEEAAKKAKEEAEKKAKEEAAKREAELKKQEEAKKKAEEEAKKKAEELKKAQEAAKKAEEEKKKAEEAAKKAKEEAERKKKEEQQKVQNQLSQAKDKIKSAAEERKKQLRQQKEEQQKKSTRTTNDNTGNKVNYTPDSYNNNNSKKRQNVLLPFDQEMIDMCVQCCCCNIF